MNKFLTRASNPNKAKLPRSVLIIKEAALLFLSKQMAKSAAAMSFHLTMTFFPLIICLYALFGQSYSTAEKLLGYLSRFLTPDATGLIQDYLNYLAGTSGTAIIIVALTFLLSSASAAMRALIGSVNDLQGEARFGMILGYIVSFIMALGLLVVFYVAFIVLLTGDSFLGILHRRVPELSNIDDWFWIRFVLLGLMALVSMWIAFSVLKPRRSHMKILPGAFISTIGVVIVSYIFSTFISASSRYALIYGSLASLILTMFWLYMVCQVVLLGACINVANKNNPR